MSAAKPINWIASEGAGRSGGIGRVGDVVMFDYQYNSTATKGTTKPWVLNTRLPGMKPRMACETPDECVALAERMLARFMERITVDAPVPSA